MIALLTGKPLCTGQECIMMCGGVGYGVHVAPHTIDALVGKSEATLHIHTHVREDALQLFGFLTREEKYMFELLLSVSGVGPKTALAITNGSSADIVDAIQTNNVSFFTSFSRVGKKVAQKIIIELKSKLGGIEDLALGDETPHVSDIRAALESLGYSKMEVSKALRAIKPEEVSIQQAIKQSVHILSGT
ncbi:MAG TPA: Holliday junction branch migration protein RuvA [Candidatus Pacebacteria bacterium]|nr:MAG: Holliday junction ATP-dependent DNA helicase RuvA [Microgenomates group bacterium GW2011_GWB1_45_17]KKU24093.1 MAG: Holliday junction ATP-dependent DNA helicase RuvA [Microgenomates group bacterium GW2011_GWC1_46_15]HAV14818.1 Holliday junction branch migration protein RuvA [Candidatus Paceibacterota bacterium]HCR11209.1 Holliday junction branch migration protein RuvA [Candidatus Paceibacterota bacterium]HCR92793.1 Holliday junction branch migration protein RuvA [Candidatus Paceibactero